MSKSQALARPVVPFTSGKPCQQHGMQLRLLRLPGGPPCTCVTLPHYGCASTASLLSARRAGAARATWLLTGISVSQELARARCSVAQGAGARIGHSYPRSPGCGCRAALQYSGTRASAPSARAAWCVGDLSCVHGPLHAALWLDCQRGKPNRVRCPSSRCQQQVVSAAVQVAARCCLGSSIVVVAAVAVQAASCPSSRCQQQVVSATVLAAATCLASAVFLSGADLDVALLLPDAWPQRSEACGLQCSAVELLQRVPFQAVTSDGLADSAAAVLLLLPGYQQAMQSSGACVAMLHAA